MTLKSFKYKIINGDFMITETERLFLRELTKDDFSALYFGRFGYNATLSIYICKTRVMNWIDKSIERYNIFGFGLWAVCLKDNGEMIGDCGLTMQIINNQIKPEIGYHFRKDMQHKGYAKEASIAVRDWTFINTPFNTVYSYMKKDNIASAAVAVSYGCK